MTSFNPQNVVTEYAKPGEILTYTVGATPIANLTVSGVIAGTLVEFSADRTVIPAQAGSLKVCGVAMHDGDAAGNFTEVPVAAEGVWPLKAAANIAAGARVMAAAVGTVTPFVPDASGLVAHPEAIIGIAQEAIASGAVGRVKLIGLG